MSEKFYIKSVDSVIKREACHSPVLNLKKTAKRRAEPKVFCLKIKPVKRPRKNFLNRFSGNMKKLNGRLLVKSSAMKFASVSLAIGLCWLALSAIGRTTASFTDTEISIDNTFNAGTLYFSLFQAQDNFVSENKSNDIMPCDSITRIIKVRNEGTIPLFYSVHFEKISGDDDFCASLLLDAKLEGKTQYPAEENSSLPDFKYSSAEALPLAAVDNWQFKISLPENASDSLKGKICDFKFVFVGGDNLHVGEGFSDTQEISSTIVSADWGNNKKDHGNNACSGDENNGEDRENNEDHQDNEHDNHFSDNEDEQNNIADNNDSSGHDLDTNGVSDRGDKDNSEKSSDSENQEEENRIVADGNSQDSFVRNDSNETIASDYAAGNGENKNDHKNE